MIDCFTAAHHQVTTQTALDPLKTAIIEADGQRVSYGELRTSVQALAFRLQTLGIGAEDRVAVWLNRSTGLLTAMLGILEAGAVYAPIDPKTPCDWASELITKLDVAAVISDRPEALSFAPSRPVLSPDCGGAESINQFRAPKLHPEQLAYIIHTSGSTGVPKGVAMSHRGLARLIDWQIASGPLGLRTLMFTPVAFDVTLQEVFSTLGSGGTLVLIDDRVRRDPERLLSALDAFNIQRLFLPYSALQQLAIAAQVSGRVPQNLLHIITAGERLIITPAIKELFRAMPNVRLDNHYGPTEAHLVTSWTLGEDRRAWPDLPAVGTAVGGVRAYVLDADLQPLPPNEPGELFVGGTGVARGYWGDPRRTVERFLPDPYSEQLGSIMYRTGDIVRQSRDGVIEFEGRSDEQLKIRGFRVEPAEVEFALCAHPHILEAAVVLRSIANDVSALVAYLVTDGSEVEHRALAEYLGTRLPEYMIPDRYVSVEELPLTSNGKIDRQALVGLKIPERSAPPDGTSLLELVRSVWQRVLGHDQFALDEDFFDVGGNSMLSTWVVNELGLALGREVSLSLFLDAGTVEASAAALAELGLDSIPSAKFGELVTLKAGPADQTLILVHPLGGELLVYRDFAKAIAAHLRVLGLRLNAQFDVACESMSLEAIATRHLEQLFAIQPIGPYRLAGWSFGGVLAYEIAQQLRARGAEVAFLGLIDSNPVLNPLNGLPTRDSQLLNELDRVLEHIDTENANARSAFLDNSHVHALLGGFIPQGVTTEHLHKYLTVTRTCIDAARNYLPLPYDGAIDLFQASASSAQLQADLLTELKNLSRGSLRVHEVPGDHFSMLRDPFVHETALTFDGTLERFTTRTGG